MKNFCLITGASGGIGAEFARAFAKNGHDLILVARSKDKLEALKYELENKYAVEAIVISADLTSESDIEQMYNHLRTADLRVDVLVNNAGFGDLCAFLDSNPERQKKLIELNISALVILTYLFGNDMKKRGRGRIVNISSVSAIIGNPGQANYSASKAGIIGLTKSAAKELSVKNITVNAVAPGFIRTDMTENIGEDNPLIQMIPLKRFGEAEEVAEAVAFLASSSYITGEVLKVDGGIAM